MSTSDRSAASSLRRRTSCIYCGTPIFGAMPRNATGGRNYHTLGRMIRRAATIACRYHLDLPSLDPDYRERL